MPKKSKLTQQADEVAAEAGEYIDRRRERREAIEALVLQVRLDKNAVKLAKQHRGK